MRFTETRRKQLREGLKGRKTRVYRTGLFTGLPRPRFGTDSSRMNHWSKIRPKIPN